MSRLAIPNVCINTLGEVICKCCDNLLTDSQIARHKYVERIKLVWKMQEHSTDRFRIYSTHNGTYLSTEFLYFADDKKAKRRIKDAAKRVGGKVFTMHSAPCCDRYSPPQGVMGEIVESECNNGLQWAYGPNHGRMEEQVDISCPVNTEDELIEMLKNLAEATQEIWDAYGVSVI